MITDTFCGNPLRSFTQRTCLASGPWCSHNKASSVSTGRCLPAYHSLWACASFIDRIPWQSESPGRPVPLHSYPGIVSVCHQGHLGKWLRGFRTGLIDPELRSSSSDSRDNTYNIYHARCSMKQQTFAARDFGHCRTHAGNCCARRWQTWFRGRPCVRVLNRSVPGREVIVHRWYWIASCGFTCRNTRSIFRIRVRKSPVGYPVHAPLCRH